MATEIKRGSAAAEFKAFDGEKGIVEMFVSVFDNVDDRGDVVRATAFDRTLAEWAARGDPVPAIPPNTRLVDWVSYERTMPRADVVVCHGGHGTIVRALSSGCVVVVAPAGGDQNENAARVDWAGAGVRIPRRLVSARSVRLAVERALGEPGIRAQARELAGWLERHDPPAHAAELVERFGAAA